MPFIQYTPQADGIYDCISPSLTDEAHFNAWLNESKKPINFTCTTCGKSTLDLTQLKFTGNIHIRVSVRKLRKSLFLPTRPWTISCGHCKSIFQILNGWIEPNNGRMITVLDRIHQLELNRSYESCMTIPLPMVDEPVRRLYHLPKSYKKITYVKDEMKFSMYLENLMGRFHETHKRNIEVFSDPLQSKMEEKIIRMINRAIRFNLKKLFRGQVFVIQSLAWLVTEIELTQNEKPVTDLADLYGSFAGEIETILIALFESIFNSADQSSNLLTLKDPALAVVELLENG